MNKMMVRLACGWGVVLGIAVAMALAAPAQSATAQDQDSDAPAQEVAPAFGATEDTPEPVAVDDPTISEAEQHLAQGVELYNRGLYREALDEFNRAVALDPELSEADIFRQKATEKLQESTLGEGVAERPTFEIIDPETVKTEAATPTWSADEIKTRRVRELMERAYLYLENGYYDKAVKHFEEILLIAPDNERAKEGLHKATLGVRDKAVKESEKQVERDRAMIRDYVEQSKALPEGADARGIKQYRITVPIIEEEYEVPREKSRMEEALEAPVTIDFNDQHISEIIDFISEYVEVNFIIDARVVEPEQKVETSAPGAAPTAPGAYPGAAGSPYAAGAGGAYPGTPTRRPGTPTTPRTTARGGVTGTGTGIVDDIVTDGVVSSIKLTNVPLRQALKALLRPLNLDYEVQESFIWISTPERIRHETFEELETRYYELKNAGAETMFKLVQTGNLQDDNASQRGNISQLVEPETDYAGWGEPPAVIGLNTAGTGRNSYSSNQQRTGGNTNNNANYNNNNNYNNNRSGSTSSNYSSNAGILSVLGNIIDDVREYDVINQQWVTLSYMDYNPLTNQLIVHNTPSNLAELEEQLTHLDVTPKQVSIEARFLTVSVNDLDKIGFSYNLQLSNLNNHSRPYDSGDPTDTTGSGNYSYDINGDGIDESIPFYTKPDGTSVLDYALSTLQTAAASANPVTSLADPNFSITGIFEDLADGDKLGVTVDYLNSLKESELLSAPRVTTMNRKPAVIADVRTEYYVSEVQTDVETTGGTDNSGAVQSVTKELTVEPYTFGIVFTVTPQISGTDHVRMWLNPTVNTNVGFSSFVNRQIINGDVYEDPLTFPITVMQSVWTNVIVHDGDTVVLGGMIKDVSTDSKEKLPYVSNIPVLGALFRGKAREVSQSSLLIFVRPDIVDTTGARFFEVGGN